MDTVSLHSSQIGKGVSAHSLIVARKQYYEGAAGGSLGSLGRQTELLLDYLQWKLVTAEGDDLAHLHMNIPSLHST